MKKKKLDNLPYDEMTQDLLEKAYSCDISKEHLLKMLSNCIEKKWIKEEEKFRKKVAAYLDKNQHMIEFYEPEFYDNFDFADGADRFSRFMNNFDSSQRYSYYLEIICAMHRLHKDMRSGIDITDLYSLLNDEHLELDFSLYTDVVYVVNMILECEVFTSTQCGEFCDLRNQYQILNNFQLTIIGMIYLVEKTELVT